MQTRVLALAGLLTAGLLTPAPTAQAAGTVAIQLRGCQVTITNNSGMDGRITFDRADEELLAAGPKKVFQFTAPAGKYHYEWLVQNGKGGGQFGKDDLTVPASCGKAPRQGDQNGDGKADVVGIQAATGDLYYYRNVGGRLSSAVKVGRGWGRMVHIQQTAGYFAGPKFMRQPALIALREDGAVFSYPQLGSGRYGTPTRIATAPRATSAFAIGEDVKADATPGLNLFAIKDGRLIGRSVPGAGDSPDAWADFWPSDAIRLISVSELPLRTVPGSVVGPHNASLLAILPDGTLERPFADRNDYRTVGRGWKPMQVVVSPGSLDGDGIGDVIARRSDGNLYSYRGLSDGRLGPAVRIGTNWQQMRLLA